MKKFQVFTPMQYVDMMLDEAGYFGEDILKKNFLENSVGDGNILLQAVKRYVSEGINSGYDLSVLKSDLENFFVAFEVDKDVIKKCINRLNKAMEEFGIFNVKWDIRNEDYLKSDLYKKFDFIIGNPPYITYQELTIDNRNYLRQSFTSCSRGKFDYCYAFIEKSLNNLATKNGKMAYLIPNSIFKNVFAANLRKIMINNIIKIIDYKHTHIFGKVLTSSSIIILDNTEYRSIIDYVDIDNKRNLQIDKERLQDKWYFVEYNAYLNENRILFGDLFKIANSVATLANKVFIVPDEVELEEEVIRPAASPRKLANQAAERIIFPYTYEGDTLKKYLPNEFTDSFPLVTKYLKKHRDILKNRKADGEWFEYGRSQGLRFFNQPKLMISSVITESVKVYELDADTIPYSGFYIVPKRNVGLEIAKEILESKDFYNYIESRAINASGRSIRISVNDVRSYPVKIERGNLW
ncbi:Eco57I restriction-modification methylase domain-containing protein [Streptococcus sp. 2022WUSS135]|uniref:Eco57I restriction-modification methylase domain-containing protein n=1 Tax=Streptococcus sp. 2022WUSS135 TaxID=2983288 RepID=UPI0037A6CB8B